MANWSQEVVPKYQFVPCQTVPYCQVWLYLLKVARNITLLLRKSSTSAFWPIKMLLKVFSIYFSALKAAILFECMGEDFLKTIHYFLAHRMKLQLYQNKNITTESMSTHIEVEKRNITFISRRPSCVDIKAISECLQYVLQTSVLPLTKSRHPKL